MADLSQMLGTVFGSGQPGRGGMFSLATPANALRRKIFGRNDPNSLEGADLFEFLAQLLSDPAVLGAGALGAIGAPMARNAINRSSNRRLAKAIGSQVTPAQAIEESAFGDVLLRELNARGPLQNIERDALDQVGGSAKTLTNPVGSAPSEPASWSGVGATPQYADTPYGPGLQYSLQPEPPRPRQRAPLANRDVPLNTDLDLGQPGTSAYAQRAAQVKSGIERWGGGTELHENIDPLNRAILAQGGGTPVGMSTLPKSQLLDLDIANRNSGGLTGRQWLAAQQAQARQAATEKFQPGVATGRDDYIRQEIVGRNADEPIYEMGERKVFGGGGTDLYTGDTARRGQPFPYRLGENPPELAGAMNRDAGLVELLQRRDPAMGATEAQAIYGAEVPTRDPDPRATLMRYLQRGDESATGIQEALGGAGPIDKRSTTRATQSLGAMQRRSSISATDLEEVLGGGVSGPAPKYMEAPPADESGLLDMLQRDAATPRQLERSLPVAGEPATGPRENVAFGQFDPFTPPVPPNDIARLEPLAALLRSNASDADVMAKLARTNKMYPTAKTIKSLLLEFERAKGQLNPTGLKIGSRKPYELKLPKSKKLRAEPETKRVLEDLLTGRKQVDAPMWRSFTNEEKSRYLRNSLLLGGKKRGDVGTGYGLALKGHESAAEIRRILKNDPEKLLAEEAAEQGFKLDTPSNAGRGNWLGLEDFEAGAEGRSARKAVQWRPDTPSGGTSRAEPSINKPEAATLLEEHGGAVGQSAREIRAASMEWHSNKTGQSIDEMPPVDPGTDWEVVDRLRQVAGYPNELRAALIPESMPAMKRLAGSNYLDDALAAIDDQLDKWTSSARGRRVIAGSGVKPGVFDRQFDFVRFLRPKEQRQVVESVRRKSKAGHERLLGLLAEHNDMKRRLKRSKSPLRKPKRSFMVKEKIAEGPDIGPLSAAATKKVLAKAASGNRKQLADFLEEFLRKSTNSQKSAGAAIEAEAKRILQEKINEAGYQGILDNSLVTMFRAGDMVAPNIGRRTNYGVSPTGAVLGMAPVAARPRDRRKPELAPWQPYPGSSI